ncbi:MAG TPA: CsbD family protein [Vicinamibacteria bacterium]|jgi:uncharacterized protein YjbJ (UPF0337 family)|nr:CsbD family protein [Vicinamibacteria bacterium]
MNEDVLRGRWAELKGRLRLQWGKLSDDDIALIRGDREILLGKLQALYGRTRDDLERELKAWLDYNRSRP